MLDYRTLISKYMYYTIYQITNERNGKIYIGLHKTYNLNDDYMGSGTYLAKAKEKYGIESFSKKILYIFDNQDDMYNMESVLVDDSFVRRNDTYNLVEGGSGGFDYINNAKLNIYGKNGKPGFGGENLISGDIQKQRMIENGTWTEYCNRLSAILAKGYNEGRPNGFKDKKHSEVTKRIIGEKNAIHQKGEGNSQFGKQWIYSEEEKQSKKIAKDEIVPIGWLVGRKMKF